MRKHVREWRGIAERRAAVDADPVNPERAIRELGAHLPSDAQIALDVGSVVYWYARQLELPSGVVAHVSGTLASMGCSVPYAIAGKLVHPDRPMIVLAGDGGMQMTGVAELITLSRMWKKWEDPRFVVCVLNNRDLAEVSWEQREMEGKPRFGASQDLPDFPYAGYAELLGMAGERVDDPEVLSAAWQRALSADRPYVLDIVSDASIPLLPPFPAGAAKLEQMFGALESEGEAGLQARKLLETYASHEGGENPVEE